MDLRLCIIYVSSPVVILMLGVFLGRKIQQHIRSFSKIRNIGYPHAPILASPLPQPPQPVVDAPVYEVAITMKKETAIDINDFAIPFDAYQDHQDFLDQYSGGALGVAYPAHPIFSPFELPPPYLHHEQTKPST